MDSVCVCSSQVFVSLNRALDLAPNLVYFHTAFGSTISGWIPRSGPIFEWIGATRAWIRPVMIFIDRQDVENIKSKGGSYEGYI